MKPLFSIITVVLNPPPDDLLLTVKSVLQQECGDWELIIKDGGSSSDSLAGVPEDPRIKIVAKADRGIFDAMNQGLGFANGSYICFLNAGDWFYDRTALRRVAEVISRNPHSEFLYGDVAKPASRSGFERYPAGLSRRYLFSHMICHQAWFVRADYYERSGHYETREISGADRRFLLRMILVHGAHHCHVPAVLVVYKGGGVSQLPEVRRKADAWINELLEEIYSREELRSHRRSERKRLYLKKLFYDTGAWRCVRALRGLHLYFKMRTNS